MRRRFALGDYGPDVATIEGEFLVEGGTGQFQKGWVPIHHVDRLLYHGACLDSTFPGCKGANPHAAFVKGAFASAEGPVARDPAGIRAAIVARKDNQRVLTPPRLVERRNDLPDGFIHGRQHPRVSAPRLLESR